MSFTLIAGILTTFTGGGAAVWLYFFQGRESVHGTAANRPEPSKPMATPRNGTDTQARQDALLAMSAPRAAQNGLRPESLLDFYQWWRQRTIEERSAPRFDGTIPGFPDAAYLLSTMEVSGRQIRLFDRADQMLADFSVSGDQACNPVPVINTSTGRYHMDLTSRSEPRVFYGDDDQSYCWSPSTGINTSSGLTSDSFLTGLLVGDLMNAGTTKHVEHDVPQVQVSPDVMTDTSPALATAY